MVSNSSKTSSSFLKCKIFKDWLKFIKVWRCFIDLLADPQGSTLVLSVEDEALDSILEIVGAEIAKENVVDTITIIVWTDYSKKIPLLLNTELYNNFRHLEDHQKCSINVPALLNLLDKRLHKTNSNGAVQSDHMLANRLSKSANFSNHHEELIKVTVPEVRYDIMKRPIEENFQWSRHVRTKSEEVVKREDTFLAREMNKMEIQQDLLTELEYNSLRTPNIIQAYDYEFETYYNRTNYRYYNHRNTINCQYQQYKIKTPKTSQRLVQQTNWEKNVAEMVYN